MGKSPRWSQGTKILVTAALLVVAGLLVWNLQGLLGQLIIAFLVAYVFAPVVGWLASKMRIGRGWATALLYIIVLGSLAGVSSFLVPVLIDQIGDLVANLDTILDRVLVWLKQTEQVTFWGYRIQLPELNVPTGDFDLERLLSLAQSTLSPLWGGAFSVVTTVGSVVAWLLLISVIIFYLLVAADRIRPALLSLAPPTYRGEISKLVGEVDRTWSSYLRGQLVLMAFVGVMTGVAMSIVGVRFAIALGLVAGLLEIIPSLGPFLSAVPAILLALFQGASSLPVSNFWAAVIVAGIYVVIQQIENHILGPAIIGSTLDMHPLFIIVGVLAGATLFGILGALLAAPVLATLRQVLRYTYCKLLDRDPFPEPPPFFERVESRGVRAILFDLDGTLIDTDDVVVASLARRLQRIPLLSRLYDSQKLARRIVMKLESPLNGIIQILDAVGLDDHVFYWGEMVRRLYGYRDPSYYVPVGETIRFLRESCRNYDIAIVTTRSRADTDRFIKQFELDECIKAVVTRQDVKRLKPHTEPVRYAAQQLGYTPEQCIMVGDTTPDIRSGKGAGALAVGVLSGFGERPELENSEADLILETAAQLMGHLPSGTSVSREGRTLAWGS